MNICRLCLAKDANFDVFGSGTTALRIIACTSLEIEPNDGLPQHICAPCRLRLEEMHHFRRRCQAADRRLRRHKVLQRQGIKTTLEEIGDQQPPLRDVAGCTTTACSESNSQWRTQAAQLIRTEIDSFKKDLLNSCKQSVRADIEHELRPQLEKVILAEAKQQVRLSVLDDVFYELESYFVRKRNETCEQVSCSESYSTDCNGQLVSDQPDELYEVSAGEELGESHDLGVVDLLDVEPEPSEQPAFTAVVPVPMVEINMNDPQLSHLRDNFNKDFFLNTTKSPKKPSIQSPCPKKVRFETPQKKAETVCRNHGSWSERYSQSPNQTGRRVPIETHSKKTEGLCRKHSSLSRRSSQPSNSGNCVRCRLRGADKLNSSVS
ncbi:uncharacterized protein LOC108091669 [Drosophila ficusphila]|uniref:uncharacterized protein LOC108091669 n=1 Tax=Drosophila ficusphila TaxID=30025 RepID=UPI0007E6CBF1|nr:uncharacterized protein LOC108091669 [Drosophila ficusphila]